MLEHTFCHLPGIGLRQEQALWSAGIRSWEELLVHPAPPLRTSAASLAPRLLRESRERLDARDASFFASSLPSGELWRLFARFRSAVLYLDIETTGLSRDRDIVTTVATYDGTCLRTYVHGQNMDDLAAAISSCGLLVTYNGRSFDIPFLEHALSIRIPQPHIDLRWILHGLGFRGGLKGCEKQLGIDRGGLAGVDGYMAVLLWNDYRRSGDERVLETLLAYNAEDAVNLERLMVAAWNLKVENTPFGEVKKLSGTARPDIPFTPDPAVIRRLSGHSPSLF